ncbi:hypothetical protein LRS74_00700 [Streptomyces sp. LX-29]|uniref:hypothetical protein n=1 Tax=Streptomyces sp. LX-29 TaxID=2900152 RepID=UPI00240E6B13|nr:hypothetical protein [Streptomyces sp. LX-29]WFB05696.1 hypothetical protein LRS74_00700 [Streptomyces sp. LX-29]
MDTRQPIALATACRVRAAGRYAVGGSAKWLPAEGAGIVVPEHRADDHDTGSLLSLLSHTRTRVVVDAERSASATSQAGRLNLDSADDIVRAAVIPEESPVCHG